jgi:hypothetical protein
MSFGKLVRSIAAATFAANAWVALAQDPWADQVVSFDVGAKPTPGYADPATTLGSPERFTGEGAFPGAVTPFNPAWGTDEIFSIGAGGQLTVRFDEPIVDDPAHAFGVDLIVFGNGGFADAAWPTGVVGGLFAEGDFQVSVSANGRDFVTLPGSHNDGFFPALGWLDLNDPYAATPGSAPSDFTRPVDPSLTLGDFNGRGFAEVVALYDGSGGGIPFDIAPSGLGAISYVRIDALGPDSPEIDAFAAVPEPATALMLLFGSAAVGTVARGRK